MTRRMGRPPYPGPVTPAEEKVLELIRKGLPNAEIAVSLGVSINTVRYHVANLLTKADVGDRRALARWKVPTIQEPRERRWVEVALITAGIGGASTAAVAAVIAFILIMRAPERAPQRPWPESTPTGTATLIPTPSATAMPSPELGPAVQGVFVEPRTTVPDEIRSLGPRPESVFDPWDGRSVMLFDMATQTAVAFESASELIFSPEGTKALMLRGRRNDEELWVIDLESLERLHLGSGGQSKFLDDEHVVTQGDSGQWERIDLDTGDRTALDSTAGAADYFSGYRVVGSALSEETQKRRQRQTWTVIREQDDMAILSVEAVLALPAGHSSIVILTEFQEGALANIFTIDLADRTATFIGTGRFGAALPVAASSRHVAWTDDYCGSGFTMVLDRSSGSLTALRENHLVSFTAGGLLGLGPDLLVDPDSFEYLAVLPPVNLNAFPVFYDWSPDGRFATYGNNRRGGMTCAPSGGPDQGVEEALADGIVTAEEYAHAVSNTLACMDANGLPHSTAWFDSGRNQWTYEIGPTPYEKLGVHDECWAKYERDVQAAWVTQNKPKEAEQ